MGYVNLGMCVGYSHFRYVYGVCSLKVCVWGMFT